MKRLPAVLILMILIAACAGSPPSTGGGGMVDATGDWTLVRGTHRGVAVPIVVGHAITMSVTGSAISGRAACNLYGGEIVVADGQLKFGPMSMTEMACDEPGMASEAAYLAALGNVRAATREGDRLVLQGPDVELVFERLPPVPTAEIVGTDWLLDSLISGEAVSSVAGDPATLRLEADGSFAGSTGCRMFSGRWVEANGEIQFTDFAMDQSTCLAGLAAQDGHVSSVLEGGFRAVVDGQRLTLTTGPGDQGLGYVTVAAAP